MRERIPMTTNGAKDTTASKYSVDIPPSNVIKSRIASRLSLVPQAKHRRSRSGRNSASLADPLCMRRRDAESVRPSLGSWLYEGADRKQPVVGHSMERASELSNTAKAWSRRDAVSGWASRCSLHRRNRDRRLSDLTYVFWHERMKRSD